MDAKKSGTAETITLTTVFVSLYEQYKETFYYYRIIPDGSHHFTDADCWQTSIREVVAIGRLNENEHKASEEAGANFCRITRVRSTK